MMSAEGIRYTNRSVWLSAFRKCMGRVPSDEKIPDDMSDEDKCTVLRVRHARRGFEQRRRIVELEDGTHLGHPVENSLRRSLALGLQSPPPPVHSEIVA